MTHSTVRRLLPILHLVPRGTSRHRHHRALPSPATVSMPLDRGADIVYCVVCIQSGRPTEATHQTRESLCGCREHIRELERDGLAAVRRARVRAGL